MFQQNRNFFLTITESIPIKKLFYIKQVPVCHFLRKEYFELFQIRGRFAKSWIFSNVRSCRTFLAFLKQSNDCIAPSILLFFDNMPLNAKASWSNLGLSVEDYKWHVCLQRGYPESRRSLVVTCICIYKREYTVLTYQE